MKIKLKNRVANGSLKNKTVRMVEEGAYYIPRDCTVPLSILTEPAGGRFKKDDGDKV